MDRAARGNGIMGTRFPIFFHGTPSIHSMVGRAGDECIVVFLAGYAGACRRVRHHLGSEVSNRLPRFSISVASSTHSLATGGDVAHSGLGSDDAVPDRFTEPSAELAELRRACSASRPATRQHLGCLRHEGIPVVLGVRRRIRAVAWAGVCVRGWHVGQRRLAMRIGRKAGIFPIRLMQFD